MSILEAYLKRVPAGSIVSFWTTGQGYRTDAIVLQGTQRTFHPHPQLTRPPVPKPPTNPARFVMGKGERANLFFTTEFDGNPGSVVITVTVELPDHSHPQDDPKVFSFSGKAGDVADHRAVFIQSLK